MKSSMALTIDRMVAEVVLKASNTTPAQKSTARKTLKRVKTAVNSKAPNVK